MFVKFMSVCSAFLLMVFVSSCSWIPQAEPQANPTEHGYWKHKPYQTTVRLYNGERMPVTKYEKVWVDTTPIEASSKDAGGSPDR